MRYVFCFFIIFCYAFVTVSYAETKNIIFPVPFYTPETNFGLAIGDILYFKNEEQKYYSNINSFLVYTVKNQIILGCVPEYYFNNEKYLIKAKLLYENFSKKFFGTGNKAESGAEEKYTERAHVIGVDFYRQILKNAKMGISYNFADITACDFENNGKLIQYDTSGLISGAGLKFCIDSRNDNMYTTEGFKLDLSWMLYDKSTGSDFSYSEIIFDFRNFIELSRRFLFSYQVYSKIINGEAPVQSLSALGGSNLMRGFYSGRYLDNIAVVIQPEIKFKITNIFSWAVFTAIGNVYNNLEEIDLKKLKIASGAGLRIKVKDNPRINFRIDFAKSNESHAIYFTMLEAF